MKSTTPDLDKFPVVIDQWTQPFWDGASRHEILMPRCAHCETWRWPPTPFCSNCRSQELEWLKAGPARIYSFTIVQQRGNSPEDPPRPIVPALVEFPEAGGMRLVAAIVESDVERLAIGAPLEVRWTPKDAINVPVFTIV